MGEGTTGVQARACGMDEQRTRELEVPICPFRSVWKCKTSQDRRGQTRMGNITFTSWRQSSWRRSVEWEQAARAECEKKRREEQERLPQPWSSSQGGPRLRRVVSMTMLTFLAAGFLAAGFLAAALVAVAFLAAGFECETTPCQQPLETACIAKINSSPSWQRASWRRRVPSSLARQRRPWAWRRRVRRRSWPCSGQA